MRSRKLTGLVVDGQAAATLQVTQPFTLPGHAHTALTFQHLGPHTPAETTNSPGPCHYRQ